MSGDVELTEAEWSDVLATLPESPEEADGWELSLVRRTVARIIAAREAAAEQRGREQGWDEGHEVCEWPNCLRDHVNPYRERA